jgi:type IV secretory pathway VirB10-like protein
MLKKLFYLSLFLSIFLVSTQASSKMYRWTDDNGNVVYSQTPPPDSRPVKSITAPPPPAVKPEEAQEKTQEFQQKLDKIAKEREKAKKKQAKKKEQAKADSARCEAARKNRETLINRPPNTLWGLPDGTFQRFTVDEREQKLETLNKAIREYCE